MSFANSFKRKHNSNAQIVANLKWVIFPENKWIKHWDGLIISLTVVLLFVIPFQIGISKSYYLTTNMVWLALYVSMNIIFFTDNSLYFIRAYRDEKGVMVLDLQKIRGNYLRTYCIPNYLSTLPTVLMYLLVTKTQIVEYEGMKSSWFALLSILKCLRFIRLPSLLASSQFVQDFKAKHNSQNLYLLRYTLLLIVVSHIFACIWSFVALAEAGMSFTEESLLSTPNWIAFWYNKSYDEGSINPIGESSCIDRYILSLFWSVQTITSIGYGNILPYTREEYFVSAALMLLSGICWAYIIGGLVGVAAGLGRDGDIYGTRLDQAGELIKNFVAEGDDYYDSLKLACSKRIKSYIHTQKTRSKNSTSGSTLFEAYPVLESLTPELQLTSCLLVMRKYLEAVHYLSSKYLTIEEQSAVAAQCSNVDFAAGESVIPRNSVGCMGAGVMVIVSGIAMIRRNAKMRSLICITSGMPFGENEVLVEDELCRGTEGEIQFYTFSRVVFIPRHAILDALKSSKTAWKECGRWRYLVSLMLSQKVAKYRQQSMLTGSTKPPSPPSIDVIIS